MLPKTERSFREIILMQLNPDRIPALLVRSAEFLQEIQNQHRDKTPAEIGLAMQQLIESDFVRVRYSSMGGDELTTKPETYEMTAKAMQLLGVRTSK